MCTVYEVKKKNNYSFVLKFLKMTGFYKKMLFLFQKYQMGENIILN